MEYSTGKTYIEFAVQLFFDAVDPQNAFLADKLALSPTNMLEGLTKAAMTSEGMKNNTVQPQVEALIERERPEILINCAAFTNVDGSETQIEACMAVNAKGPENLAKSCKKHGVRLIHHLRLYVEHGEYLFRRGKRRLQPVELLRKRLYRVEEFLYIHIKFNERRGRYYLSHKRRAVYISSAG